MRIEKNLHNGTVPLNYSRTSLILVLGLNRAGEEASIEAFPTPFLGYIEPSAWERPRLSWVEASFELGGGLNRAGRRILIELGRGLDQGLSNPLPRLYRTQRVGKASFELGGGLDLAGGLVREVSPLAQNTGARAAVIGGHFGLMRLAGIRQERFSAIQRATGRARA